MFRHGYQSWSPSGIGHFDVDVDPSTLARFPFVQAVHHADQATVTLADELRSEWFTLLAHDGPATCCWPGSTVAAGTTAPFGCAGPASDREVELWAEAFLGDAVLAPGARRELHGVVVDDRGRRAGVRAAGRVGHPIGHELGARSTHRSRSGGAPGTSTSTRHRARHPENLSRASQFGFEVFQIDDGFQSAIGDWLTTNAKFPAGLDDLASSIDAAGFRPGCGWHRSSPPPTRASPSSTPTGSPDARRRQRRPAPPVRLVERRGAAATTASCTRLDTSHPEVLEHLGLTGRGARRPRVHVPEARLHVRALGRRCVGRQLAHACGARPARLRRHPPRRGHRRLPARLRRAAVTRGRRGRRQPDQPGRGATVGPRRASTPSSPATTTSSPPPATPTPTRWRGASCTGSCGSTTPTASCCAPSPP